MWRNILSGTVQHSLACSTKGSRRWYILVYVALAWQTMRGCKVTRVVTTRVIYVETRNRQEAGCS